MSQMAEDMECDLQFRLEMLEARLQRMLRRVEGSHLQQTHLRQRFERLDGLCEEVQERVRFLSDLEVQLNVTGISHGAMETQDESVDVTAGRKRWGMNEEVAIEIESLVKQLVEKVKERIEAAELSVDPLQQTERESRVQEDSVRDDERSAHPSMRLRFSDEPECHLIDDPGQVKKVDEPREAKDVRMEQQTDKCGKKSIVLFQEVEQLKETEEIDPIKAEEYNGKTNGLDKKLEVKGIVELEGERKSEDVQRKSEELEIQSVDIAGNDPKDLMDLDKESKTETAIITLHGMDKSTYGRTHFVGSEKMERDLSHESRNLSVEKQQHCYPFGFADLVEIREDLESLISNELVRQVFEVGRKEEGIVQSKAEEEVIEHDYELEMAEMEVCFKESELNTSEELERRLFEQAKKQGEIIQSKIIISLKLIIDNIEKKMHVKMPNHLRKSLDECFREVIQFSLKTSKMHIHLLESELRSGDKLTLWLHGQIRRLTEELRKKARQENSFRERICELEQNLNSTVITLQASDNYGQQLLGKYNEVTLNIEREMKKHRSMCEDYRKLRSKYRKLEAKCESTVKSEGGLEVAGQVIAGTDKEQEDDRCAASDLEEQMSVLACSQKELKSTVRSYSKVTRVVGSLDAEMVEDSEFLDNHRKELMDALKSEQHLQCEMLEAALTKARKDHDYFWKGVLKELDLTLFAVAQTDSPLLTNLLLEYGFSQEWMDEEGNTALHCAARRGNVHVGQALIRAGGQVNFQNICKMTPLHMSLYYGHVNFSLMLLRNEANVNLKEVTENTPLHLASITGNYVMVNQLIKSKADVNAVDADGDTPFFNAAIDGNEGIAGMLFEAGSDITAINGMGSTPLHVAAWQGRVALCRYLINLGVPVDPINFYGVTPLQLAAMEDHEYVVHLLINRGSRVNCVEDGEDSPLHYAAKFCNIFMMKGLILAGANVSATNFEKRTPLHIAAAEGHIQACSVLLDAESNVNALDVKNRTPLHMVAMYGRSISLAEALVKEGADMAAADSDGLTPCDLGYVFKNSLFSRWLKKRIRVNQPPRGKGSRRKKSSRAVP